MQKALRGILAVAGRVLFIGVSVQIVLGLVWLVYNFTGCQQFGETFMYEEISKTLICDEYEGILYPVLIRMAKGIEGLLLIPYRYFLYLLQLGVAFGSAYTLLRSVGFTGRLWRIWGSLAFLTFPMAMQCHVAVLPDSLVCSCLLLAIAFAVETIKGEGLLRFAEFTKVLLCGAAMTLLLPDYGVVGAVPVLFLFLYGLVKTWKRDKKRILYYMLLLLAFAGILCGVNSLTRKEGYYGKTHRSVQASIASRCAWQYIGYHYDSLPEEVQACLTATDAMYVSCYAHNVEGVLGRALEATVGVERTQELFLELAKQAWEEDKYTIVHNTAWDVVGYTFAPMVVQRQFDGKAYDSYTGRNYDIMREKEPVLTKYYMDYGCRWFAAGLAITTVVGLMCAAWYLVKRLQGKAESANYAGVVYAVMLCLCTSGVLVLFYSLRGAGMMDYKKSIAVTLLWILWMLLVCRKGMDEEKEA